MKIRDLLLFGLVTSLTVPASRAAVYPFAEYHLGEPGSLSGARKLPQDSSGSNRHFTDGPYPASNATISSATSPAATGSTACVDTTAAGSDSAWGGGYWTYDLPTTNYAFGVFAQTPSPASNDSVPVFALANGDYGALGIRLDTSGWRAQVYSSDFIQGKPGTYVPNTWTHLAIVCANNQTRFYINGVDQGSTLLHAPLLGPAVLGIKGLLDEARVVTFNDGEPTANIIAALQAGAVPTAFVKAGANVVAPTAGLSPAEASVFRLGGAVRDSVKILTPGGLSVVGTAPDKHIIQIFPEGPLTAGRYPLITYSGAIGGQGFDGLQLAKVPGRFTATLENNVANSTIDLVLAGPDGITWTGAASNAWDTTSTNWVLNGGSTPTQYLPTDSVTFNDSAAGGTISIPDAVSPAFITVNAAADYTFSGAGFTGTAGFIKSGTGTMALVNDNTNTGAITINGGTLSVGDGGTTGSLGSGAIVLAQGGKLAVNRTGDDFHLSNTVTGSGGFQKLGAGRLFPGNAFSYPFTGHVTISAGEVIGGYGFGYASSVSVAAGSDIDAAGTSFNSPMIVSGSGVDGQGALKNTGPAVTTFKQMFGGMTLVGDTTVGSNWGMSTSYQGSDHRPYVSGNFGLTKAGDGALWFNETDFTVKDITITAGRFVVDSGTTIPNSPAGTIHLNGGQLEFAQTYNEPTTCSKPIALNGGMIVANGGYFSAVQLNSPVELDAPQNTILAEPKAPVTGSSGFPIPPSQIMMNGVVSGNGSLVMAGYGTVTLAKAPAYKGDTTIVGAAGSPYFAGRLKLMASGLDDASTVSIGSAQFLELAFSGTDTVSKLFIGGVQQAAGVYNSSHPSGRFAGAGSLTVTNGPTQTDYQLWEIANGIAGAGAAADSDHDGITNGVEFVIGGKPSGDNSDSRSLLPTGTMDGTDFVFVFRRTQASFASATCSVLYGSSFTNAVVAHNGYDGVTIVEETDGFGPGVNKVTCRISQQPYRPTLLARLQVDIP
jgi:autotransporter-associated beta strand protein